MLSVQILEPFTSDVRIYLGRRQVAVPQQQLYDAQVSTTIQKMRSEGMAKAVWRHLLTNTGLFSIALDDVPERLARHAIAAASWEQVIRLPLEENFHSRAIDEFFQPML